MDMPLNKGAPARPAPDTPAPLSLARRQPVGVDTVLTLDDGRRLGMREHGDPGGVPTFYIHGWPGSRLEPGYFPFPGIRLIAVDRPGYGLSDPADPYHLMDWAADLAVVADHLKLDRFAVVGVSGGGPYAMAAARGLSDRIFATTLICPLGPPEAPGMDSGKITLLRNIGGHKLARSVLFRLARQLILLPQGEDQLARLHETRADEHPDIAALDPDFARYHVGSWREALRYSAEGMASDARIYSEAWPFALEEITTPVRLWHGDQDDIVPSSIGQYYAKHLPHCDATFLTDEGHVSIVRRHLDAIVAEIVAAGTAD